MWLFDKLTHRGNGIGIWDDVQISPVVAANIQECLNAFYAVPKWNKRGVRLATVQNTLTNYLATLCTTEMTVNCGTGARAEWISEQIAPLLLNMQRTVQLAAAGGETIIKPYVSGTTIQFDLVQAGRFFPTRFSDNGSVEAGFFCDHYDSRKGKFVRIETFDLRNGTLTITNKAYRTNNDVLSAEVPLNQVEKWASITPKSEIHNMDRPLFGIIKMPFPNTIDDTSLMPVSLYANALDNLQEFDLLYTEFLYEYHSGKRKRIVERSAVRPRRADTPGSFPVGLTYTDKTIDTYLIVDSEEPGKPFDDYTPQIRSADYLTGLKTVLAVIENQCGISPGTLAIDDRTGAVTATQIISNDRTTYNTCNAIQRQGMEQGLLDAIHACDVLADLYNLAPAGDIEPSVSFGDSIFEDTAQEFARQMQLANSGYLKPELLLSWYFGCSEEEAKQMIPEQQQTSDFANMLGGLR